MTAVSGLLKAKLEDLRSYCASLQHLTLLATLFFPETHVLERLPRFWFTFCFYHVLVAWPSAHCIGSLSFAASRTGWGSLQHQLVGLLWAETDLWRSRRRGVYSLIIVTHLYLHFFSPPVFLTVLSESPLQSLTCPSQVLIHNLQGSVLGPLLTSKLLCRWPLSQWFLLLSIWLMTLRSLWGIDFFLSFILSWTPYRYHIQRIQNRTRFPPSNLCPDLVFPTWFDRIIILPVT